MTTYDKNNKIISKKENKPEVATTSLKDRASQMKQEKKEASNPFSKLAGLQEELHDEETKDDTNVAEPVAEPVAEETKVAEPVADETPKIVTEVNPNKVTPKAIVMPTPQSWQRITMDGGTPKLLNQLVFLGQRTDYNVGMKHRYKFANLNYIDGTNRIITAKFPKDGVAGEQERINYKGYDLEITKYGNSAVCRLSKDDELILDFVSLATVIDVLQDLLNPTDVCDISWGQIDQSIKLKRGLKSRIKELTDDDSPVSQRTRKTTDAEVVTANDAPKTEDTAALEDAPKAEDATTTEPDTLIADKAE